MKTISTNYKLTTNGKKMRVSLVALFRAVGIGGEVSEAEVPGNVLDTLRVQLVRPGVTGAEVLTDDTSKPCHYYLDGSMLDVSLAGLTGGVHRLTVLAKYGTNCHALLIADLEAPANVLYLEAGDVVMPLARMAEKDTEVDGVKYYAFAYKYGNKLAWLLDEQPQHLRGTVDAYYVENLAATFEDATKLEGARLVLNKPGKLVYDNGEIIALSPVDTFGSVGGGDDNNEHVIVHLTAPVEVDWESLVLKVVMESESGQVREIPLDVNGRCSFDVPVGEVYTVIYPIVDGYTQLKDETFTALMYLRNLARNYTDVGLLYERVNIFGRVISKEQEHQGILHDQVVTITTTDGGTYTGAFDNNNYCAIDVPYGKVYTVHLPEIENWDHEHGQFTYTAGIPSRELLVHYSQVMLGIFAIDQDGLKYTKEELQALEDKSKIVAVGVNTSTLALAERGDGTYGCGFAIKMPNSRSQKQWAASNVSFDPTRLPYYTSSETASGDYKGALNTLYIRQIAEELFISSPAADWCNNEKLTIAGVERDGFLGSFGQLYVLSLNFNAVAEMFTICGQTLPGFNPYIFTSTQYSDTDACIISGINLDSRNKNLTFLYVIPFFDI